MSSLLLSQENDTIIYFPHIASDNTWATGLAFCNPNELDTLVNLEMRDIYGVKQGEAQVDVPAYSQAPAQFARNLFGNGFPLGFSGYVKAESEQPINGLEIFINSPKGMAGLSAIPNKDLSKTLYFPHFDSGLEWWSGVGICNPNNQEARLNFKAYDTQGNLKSTVEKKVVANAQLKPELVRNLFSNLSMGTGWINVESNVPIAGIEVFGRVDNGDTAGLSACNELSKELYFPKVVEEKDLSEANPNTQTGFSFVNPNNEKANIIASAYNNEGFLIHTKEIIVNPREAKPQMSSKLFPDLREGYVELSSDKEITAMQLYMDSESNISGTLATRIKKANPIMGKLEDLLYGGAIGNALIRFYERDDITEIDETRTDSKGEFLIPPEARRIGIFHNDYILRRTNVLTGEEIALFNLISNNESAALAVYKECFLNQGLGGKLQKPLPGAITQFYIDKSNRYTNQTIPLDWINSAKGAIAKAQEAYPEGLGSASIVEGTNPPIHTHNSYLRPNKGIVWIAWADYLKRTAIHYELGDDGEYPNKSPSPGGKITAGKVSFGTELSARERNGVYLQEQQGILGARMDTRNGVQSIFADLYASTHSEFTDLDKKAIKIMRNRPLAHELTTIDYDPVIN